VSLVSLVSLALIGVAGAAAAPPPVAEIPRALIETDLGYTHWAFDNDVYDLTCAGVGKGRASPGAGILYRSFKCAVKTRTKGSGTVLVAAVTPEFARVVKILTGKLKPDHGIGALPRGSTFINSRSQAPDALTSSAWGKRVRVDTAICFGVGPWRGTSASLFQALVCRVMTQHTVVIVTTGPSSVRVVRQLD
jgi:hypothetical protein